MKTLFLALVFSCISFISIISATESKNIPFEILISEEMPLTQENIALGIPIHAYVAKPRTYLEIAARGECGHNAYYIGGIICTDIPTKPSKSASQEVWLYGSSNKTLRSDIWNVETLNGEKYIIFSYKDFRVFSTKNSQFVIAN